MTSRVVWQTKATSHEVSLDLAWKVSSTLAFPGTLAKPRCHKMLSSVVTGIPCIPRAFSARVDDGCNSVSDTARMFPSAGWRCRQCCEELGRPACRPAPCGKHWAPGLTELMRGGLPLTLSSLSLSHTGSALYSPLSSLSSRLPHASPNFALIVMRLPLGHSKLQILPLLFLSFNIVERS